jgi:ACS family sodium-dependent inorganic phosphate cotransporter
VTGAIINDNSSSVSRWQTVFLLAAAVTILGNVVFLVLGSSEVQPWNEPLRPRSQSDEEEEEE